MTHRPWPIVIIALFHIFSPLVNFMMSARLVNLSTSEYFAFQMQRMSFDFLFWGLPFLAGVALLTFRQWSYYVFLAFMVGVSIFTLYQRLAYPHRVSVFLFLFLELINFIVILYFLSPVVKRIYINKRIRWWQQKPRFILDIPCQLRIDFSNPNLPPLNIKAEIQNISEGGAFIQTLEQLNSKDRITLNFAYSNRQYAIPAQIIHARDSGYGVLFSESLVTKVELKKLSKDLKNNGIIIRGKELSLIESFNFWLKDLLKSGHGIFPDAK